MTLTYSAVIPVYNSEQTVGETVRQVRAFFQEAGLGYELVLVNDGSRDGSWEVISTLAREFTDVTAINLLKNYGQHHANLCGFRHASGDYVVTLDDDLQNPPQEIGKLIEAAGEEYDLVIGRFRSKQHAGGRRLGSRVAGWLIRKAFRVEDDLSLTNFRLIRRDVVDRVCRDRSANPYIPGLVLQYSARRTNVDVDHHPRAHGQSTYTLRKLARLVATILFNHSTMPLRASAAFGFVVALVSFALGAYFFIHTLVNGSRTPGWPTVVVLLSFFNGVLIVLISVIGEYLVRGLRDQRSLGAYEVSDIVR